MNTTRTHCDAQTHCDLRHPHPPECCNLARLFLQEMQEATRIQPVMKDNLKFRAEVGVQYGYMAPSIYLCVRARACVRA